MRALSRDTTPAGALIGACAPDATGIVHLGLGNFHRAHAAVFTAEALAVEGGDWGIAGFANASDRVAGPMRAQDHRYSILELSGEGTRAGVVDVHRRVGVVAADPGAFVASLVEPGHRILTLTVSEVGYSRSPRTGALDVDHADVRADLDAPQSPRTAVGLVARGLTLRAETGEPFTVLSCDNLQSAGRATRQVVTEFLQSSGATGDVLDFVANRVSFPNAMVDRIVPGTTPQTSDEVAALLGVVDRAPVRAEKFSMWVLEDDFAAGRPAWDRAGAIMSDEVEAYELVKLRLLNGSHSLIAYLGGLDGQPTIPDAWSQDFVRDAVLAGIRDDYLPSIRLPRGFDSAPYVEQLTHRWGNTALGDRTARVGSDGSTKLLQRIPDAALHALADGRVPHMLALTTAAWIAAVSAPPGFDAGPVAAEMNEPARERLAQATRGARTAREHARRVLTGGFLPDALVAHESFAGRVEELVDTIVHHGARAAAREATAASAARTETR
ncbi:mannitol dehydrogenase family protein [Microbacterium hatanonis]|uniref:Mannitol-1-phosphate 5-dehydrogenase n=1 Tax=Microbacterium hatanonis TaxID=404366 RepID=A0A5C8HZN6_9MICO|nr:mannitol dehydrogenase family protein [Microbacterium hatanonis]TXK12107.1 mannitol dehydrogenase family protein [Microbacterium hatanonis]